MRCPAWRKTWSDISARTMVTGQRMDAIRAGLRSSPVPASISATMAVPLRSMACCNCSPYSGAPALRVGGRHAQPGRLSRREVAANRRST